MSTVYYQDDAVTIYHGDCREILPTVGPVDAVVSDPPWKDYETGWYDASEWHQPIAELHPGSYMPLLYDLLRSGGALLCWCDWQSFHLHATEASRAGFEVRNCVVWAKPNHTAGDLTGNFGYQHEMAVFATKGDWRVCGQRPTNLWHEGHLFSRARRDHPTQKPIGLMRRCISALTNTGAVVLDPFMGSGTTLRAAKDLGRKAIGIEQEERYCEVAARRMLQSVMALEEAA